MLTYLHRRTQNIININLQQWCRLQSSFSKSCSALVWSRWSIFFCCSLISRLFGSLCSAIRKNVVWIISFKLPGSRVVHVKLLLDVQANCKVQTLLWLTYSMTWQSSASFYSTTVWYDCKTHNLIWQILVILSIQICRNYKSDNAWKFGILIRIPYWTTQYIVNSHWMVCKVFIIK